MRPWISLAAVLVLQAGCNCGGRITRVVDSGHPYDRALPAGELAAGATHARSAHFQLVGEVNAPAGAAAKSQNFQLHGGVVEASQQ